MESVKFDLIEDEIVNPAHIVRIRKEDHSYSDGTGSDTPYLILFSFVNPKEKLVLGYQNESSRDTAFKELVRGLVE